MESTQNFEVTDPVIITPEALKPGDDQNLNENENESEADDELFDDDELEEGDDDMGEEDIEENEDDAEDLEPGDASS